MKARPFLLLAALLLFARAEAGNPCHNCHKTSCTRKYEVNGTVTHADNKKPMKGVTITAVLASKKEKMVLSDEEGTFNFEELKPGTYKFIFEKPGYKKITKDNITVKADDTYQLNVEMIEQDSFDIIPSPFSFARI